MRWRCSTTCEAPSRRAIAVIGRSLGSGVASHVAAQRPVARLVLVTPFDSLADVGQAHYRWLPVRWLVKDRYESARYLAKYHGPVLVIRAGRDQVIPAASTHRLIASLPRRRRSSSCPRPTTNDLDARHSGSGAGPARVRRTDSPQRQSHESTRAGSVHVLTYAPRLHPCLRDMLELESTRGAKVGVGRCGFVAVKRVPDAEAASGHGRLRAAWHRSGTAPTTQFTQHRPDCVQHCGRGQHGSGGASCASACAGLSLSSASPVLTVETAGGFRVRAAIGLAARAPRQPPKQAAAIESAAPAWSPPAAHCRRPGRACRRHPGWPPRRCRNACSGRCRRRWPSNSRRPW